MLRQNIRELYYNKPIRYNGRLFFNGAHKARYIDLMSLAKTNNIQFLKVYPHYNLSKSQMMSNGNKIGRVSFAGTFEYWDNDFERIVVEKIISVPTGIYRTKLAWFLTIYGSKYIYREIKFTVRKKKNNESIV